MAWRIHLSAPLGLVLALSVVIGLVMVLVFRYTSDQKAIARAKDHLKAQLLAVRLFQDQLPVVMRAYGRIVRGTGSYLRLAFTPLLIAILPITVLIIQLDRYFGWMPLRPGQAFLVEARITDPEALSQARLQLPPLLTTSAPAVHIPASGEVLWRLVAEREGKYEVRVAAGGHSASKQVVVLPGLARISPIRLRDRFWERILVSAEPALEDNSPIQSVTVTYPPRILNFAWTEWNWIVLFFVVSLIAGFFFKTLLGIEV